MRYELSGKNGKGRSEDPLIHTPLEFELAQYMERGQGNAAG